MQANPQTNPELHRVLGRALVDDKFRKDIFANPKPDAPIPGYNLEPDECRRVRDTDLGELDSAAQSIQRHIAAHFV